MRRWAPGWAAGAIAVGVLAVVLGWGLSHPALQRASANLIGQEAPELTLRNLGGGESTLNDFRGHPVVLNFWASWCVPCRLEAPALNAAASSTPGVQFLGADIQDSDAAAATYQAEFRSPYPVGPIVRGSYLRFGVVAPPETYFINARGVMVARFIGPLDTQTLARYLAMIQ